MSDQSITKQELWRHRIHDYRNSGLAAHEWCTRNGLSISALRYWIRNLNRKQARQDNDSKPVFAQLPVLTASPVFSSAPVTICLGTIRIEIAESCHPELLSNLIGILKEHA